MGPEALTQVLRPLADLFPPAAYPNLIVGLGAPDDAAVYRLNADQAIISTADFFPPVVDDAYTFGAIAAANALSDVYAMGGEPLFALNLAAFPDDFPAEVMSAILQGGAEKVKEAGAAIAGGHTVTDREPKYGLAVTGLVHPERIFTKGGFKPGDVLILTKPLGTGVITTAHKRGQVDDGDLQAATASMMRLNHTAARLARLYSPSAVTDITGFGLLGHLHEMAHLSGAGIALEFDALPWLPHVARYAAEWVFPGGSERNETYFGQWVTYQRALRDWEKRLLYDPQTSGGLAVALHAAEADAYLGQLRAAGEVAWIIGRVEASEPGTLIIR